MRSLAAVFFACTAFITISCTDPDEARRQFLLTEMQQLQNTYSVVTQELGSRKQQVGYLEQKLGEQRQELAAYQRRVQAYMMDHKMAIAALAAGVGGTAVAFDANNEFSDEAQGTAALVGAVAGLWALNNMEEVMEVGDTLMQADQYVKKLNTQISTTQRQLNSARAPVADLEMQASGLQQSYQATRAEYESLQ